MAEKKTTQTKASMRNGRASKSGGVYNANHNTLEVTRKGQPHIDDQKFELNRYWKFAEKDHKFTITKIEGGKGGFDSRKHERAIYEKNMGMVWRPELRDTEKRATPNDARPSRTFIPILRPHRWRLSSR